MERPILFSTPMVHAILDGRKTQTRRITKPQPFLNKEYHNAKLIKEWYSMNGSHNNLPEKWIQFCPYGNIGDILWVRETWHYSEHKTIPYLRVSYKATPDNGNNKAKWKPSIFMPKQFSRIRLQITNIRVEKLCDITEEDAMAEGITLPNYAEQAIKDIHYPEPSDVYAELWDEINGTGAWIKNPWVWVIVFNRPK